MTEAPATYSARARAVLSPTQLNRLARGLLEDALSTVWVEGEVSNLTRASSGHWYFTLKDAQAQIRCAMFKSNNLYVRTRPTDGAQVLVRGRVSLYEARGDYQLICEHMEEAGQGRLMREYEALKAKLQAEGLTDPANKRSLPRFPRRIAVITSPQGAAVRDVLSVLARRWPLLQVDIFPAQVQGAEAPAQLRAALANALAGSRAYDLILLTRGGGSLEDLAAFNDEALARAIAASPVPTVSAVGHEVDFTIADFVADLRAPTPSAAAELITPSTQQMQLRLDELHALARSLIARKLQTLQQSADQCERLLRAHDPRRALTLARVRSEQQQQRLLRALQQRLRILQQRNTAFGDSLRTTALSARIARRIERNLSLGQRLSAHASRLHLVPREALRQARQRLLLQLPDIRERRQRLDAAMTHLQQLGPQSTLGRGYVLLLNTDGQLVTRAAATFPGQTLIARFADGDRIIRVLENL